MWGTNQIPLRQLIQLQHKQYQKQYHTDGTSRPAKQRNTSNPKKTLVYQNSTQKGRGARDPILFISISNRNNI